MVPTYSVDKVGTFGWTSVFGVLIFGGLKLLISNFLGALASTIFLATGGAEPPPKAMSSKDSMELEFSSIFFRLVFSIFFDDFKTSFALFFNLDPTFYFGLVPSLLSFLISGAEALILSFSSSSDDDELELLLLLESSSVC